ncbi:unnamed protein product [Spirodela intermedia]|uniref:Carboxypeptidase n=1 Tax=Spirodela intermedia TaxID=51605 RepID=A0A7I8JZI0_SPIIN|nr:unnamed protein product [Spirodela intermedia]
MRQGDALDRKKNASPGLAGGKASSLMVGLDAMKSRIMPQDGLKEKDKIAKLPGQPDGVDFLQYGGYITVDEKAGRALYYYFAEAPDAASRPLLLWLNGGPGCSSIGYGAMEELGPFRVMSDGKTLFRNPYAWNNVANVLFLESPAGVGFSYSNTTADYQMSGDSRSAEDAYVFLVNWLGRFAEYKTRDFYIAGESYAGHYVPQLAHNIYHFNQLPGVTVINLKGIAIGNAVINDLTDEKGMYDFFWTHAFTSDQNHETIKRNCDFTFSGGTDGDACQAALAEASAVFYDVDIYNIYGPLCFDGNLTRVPKTTSIYDFDPCSDYYVQSYLNDPAVQEALHANVTRLDYPWSACSSDLPAWLDSTSTVLPLLQEFMANGWRVWVYSGDTDGRVPVTSSRYSVDALELPVKAPWRPWSAVDEVGGYSITYKGDLTLATVRGAGHEVPSFQAQRSLVLIQAFLEGKPLPDYIVE